MSSPEPLIPGQRLSVSDHWNPLVARAFHDHALGPGSLWDSRGVMQAPRQATTPTEKYIELKDNLSPGGVADAYERPWNGSQYVTNLSGTPFEVVDVLGIFRGRGVNSYSQTWNGSRGRVVRRNGQWELDALQPHALAIKCQVNMVGGLATTDTNIIVANVTISHPIGGLLATGLVGSLPNTFNFESDHGGVVWAEWNEDQVRFEPVQVICPV
jgi:hypothetical protein